MRVAETKEISPIGTEARASAERRRARSREYRVEEARVKAAEQIARLVIAYRLERNLTQKQLAERIGTSYSAISRIESGQHQPSLDTLRRLAAAFGATLVVGFDFHDAAHRPRELVAL